MHCVVILINDRWVSVVYYIFHTAQLFQQTFDIGELMNRMWNIINIFKCIYLKKPENVN